MEINSKWLKDLSTGYEVIKLIEENIGKTFSDINYAMFQQIQSPRTKINKNKNKQMKKLRSIKFTVFCWQKLQTKLKNLHNGRKYLQTMQLTGLIFKIHKTHTFDKIKTKPNQKSDRRPK